MSHSIADIAHEIIAKVNENKRTIINLQNKLKRCNDKAKCHVDDILFTKLNTEVDDVLNEFLLINSRVHRQGNVLLKLEYLIDDLISSSDK
jgi:hypothetical protein